MKENYLQVIINKTEHFNQIYRGYECQRAIIISGSRRGGDRGSRPHTSIFQVMGLKMVKLCQTHPGLKLDPSCENFLDPHMLTGNHGTNFHIFPRFVELQIVTLEKYKLFDVEPAF